MVRKSSLKGYLLEEALAWLMRHSGYELLVSDTQDPDELLTERGSLWVKGRGTNHQVDVLGEFAFTPAFSLPVRLFLEAKFLSRAADIRVVRNAHGTLADVNQNFVAIASSRPRRRFQYCYALFSANGFTPEAEAFALAHQISLVNLSIPGLSWLLDAVSRCADRLHAAAERRRITRFPVGAMRTLIRQVLGTAPIPPSVEYSINAPRFREDLELIVGEFARALHEHGNSELLIGFPPAPFVLPLTTESRSQFVDYSLTHPSHPVIMRPVRGNADGEWELSPRDAPGAYRVTFHLPKGIEVWLAESEERRSKRIRSVKSQFLSTITVYFEEGANLHVCHLRYEASQIAELR
ncbi:hypothetical protein GCM10010168_81990 [Actinoplanes ianthinogenes]|uniref:Restriction endonuclease type IV Mrr domain-containing protein n=1 Tax=Actinoplanes ianthinogenes TaxID=122358 RepID=A0ABM7LMG5_9ACTN|nr:hypothetical protein [Actinoplanes ianthinogenes]BCJ40467.1 hypothetical protein Aiant_11240 [Actinoplanes ianthinogenes]GGR50683.1 hypothetical protein GCM10010168_81990 [Actinoplanes ianthinogenes]